MVEALKHGGFHHGGRVEIDWIQAEDVEGLLAGGRLRDLDGIVIPGGFGERGFEGKIAAAGYAREHNIPCLGLCLGMQAMVVEYARNVLGLAGANSSEFDSQSPHPVIDLMESQRDVTDLGGTMRLGAYVAELAPDSHVARAYGKTVVSERHRHRYEFNPKYRSRFEGSGLQPPGPRPTAASWSSSSSTTTPTGSAPRRTPSSRAAPPGRPRCSGSSSARPWPVPRAASRTCSRCPRVPRRPRPTVRSSLPVRRAPPA